MRNHNLLVLADLKIQLQSIHTHFHSIGHGSQRILRPETCTAPVSLRIHVRRHVHIINPLLSEPARHANSDLLRILARSRREIMSIQLRTPESRNLLAQILVGFVNDLDI